MLLGRAIDHGIEEKRPGGEIDNGCAGNAERTNIAARQT